MFKVYEHIKAYRNAVGSYVCLFILDIETKSCYSLLFCKSDDVGAQVPNRPPDRQGADHERMMY